MNERDAASESRRHPATEVSWPMIDEILSSIAAHSRRRTVWWRSPTIEFAQWKRLTRTAWDRPGASRRRKDVRSPWTLEAEMGPPIGATARQAAC